MIAARLTFHVFHRTRRQFEPLMRTITTILWDVGGTLMDWATPGDDSLACACRACGLDPALLEPSNVVQARREYDLDEPTWRTADDERAGWRRHAAALLRDARVS